jgi:hypothetical protein
VHAGFVLVVLGQLQADMGGDFLLGSAPLITQLLESFPEGLAVFLALHDINHEIEHRGLQV